MRSKSERKLCGAKRRNGEGTCRLIAGHGTTHPGYGRCKYHGGNTPSSREAAANEAAAALDVHIEDLLDNERFAKLVSMMKYRADVTDLTDDVAVVRALILDFINTNHEDREMLKAWYGSFDPDYHAELMVVLDNMQAARAAEDWDLYKELLERIPHPADFLKRPAKLPQPADAVGLIERLSRIVDTMHSHIEGTSVPLNDVHAMLLEIANALERTLRQHIGDVPSRARIIASFQAAVAEVRLPSWETTRRSTRDDLYGHGGSGGMDA